MTTPALQAQRQLDLIADAIAAVQLAANEDRKVTHAAHVDPFYTEALDQLELKQEQVRAWAFRVQVIGR